MKTRFEFGVPGQWTDGKLAGKSRLLPVSVRVLEWRLVAGGEFLTHGTRRERDSAPDVYADAIRGVCAVTCDGVTVRVEAAVCSHDGRAHTLEDLAREAVECAKRNRHLFAETT
jgi:hypothetical protein